MSHSLWFVNLNSVFFLGETIQLSLQIVSEPMKFHFLRNLICQKHSLNCCVVVTSSILSIIPAQHFTCGLNIHAYRNKRDTN